MWRLAIVFLIVSLASTAFAQDSMFAPARNYTVGLGPHCVVDGDFNGDGFIDLATANYVSHDVAVLFNLGDGTLGSAIFYSASGSPVALFAGDLNNDGFIDLAVADETPEIVSILLNDGFGNFSLSNNYPCGVVPFWICGADFNNDNSIDLAVCNYTDPGSINILFNNGMGQFSESMILPTTRYPVHISAADFNNDDNMDLITANRFNNNISVLLNNGNGTFQPAINYSTGVEPFYTCSGDLNGDGLQDIAVANRSRTVSILINTGEGFIASDTINSSGINYSILCSDLNLDGINDLAVTNAYDWKVSIYINDGNAIFQNPNIYDVEGLPCSIIASDLDNDGDKDVITANSYSNSISILNNLTRNRHLWNIAAEGNDSTGTGSTINPFRTIQHGIDVAGNGDTVLVEQGIYHENLIISAKSVILGSHYLFTADSSYISSTIIDGDSIGSVMTCIDAGGSLAMVRGFTLRHGLAQRGGGILCRRSEIIISNNIIADNIAIFVGGGIFADSCNATIVANTIKYNIAQSGSAGGISCNNLTNGLVSRNIINNNSAGYTGGGICLSWSDIQVSYNLIINNIAMGTGYWAGGGAIWCSNSSPTLLNNTICNNQAEHGSGLLSEYNTAQPQIRNSILWNNSPEQIYIIGGSSVHITYSDIQNGWAGNGNINLDPLFVEPEASNYTLRPISPCIDAGNPEDMRDPDGSIIDMGAFVFDRCQLQITVLLSPPSDASADTSTWLTWTDPFYDVCTQIRFELQIDDDSLFASPEIDINNLYRTGLALDGSLSIRLGTLEGFANLQDNSTYYWRVRSVNISIPSMADWSNDLRYFNLDIVNDPPNPPVSGFSPSNYEEIISLIPTISWNDAYDPDGNSDSLRYAIRISLDSLFSGFVYHDTTNPGINQIQPSANLNDNAHYFYQVKTIDNGGLSSNWSVRQNFWTNHYNFPPEPFPIYSPADSVKQVVYYTHFSWGNTEDYDPNSSFTFKLQCSPDSTFAGLTRSWTGLNDTSFTIATDTLVQLGQHLYWRVAAVDDDTLSRIGGIPDAEVRRITIVPSGDANSSGTTNGLDVTFLVNYFKGGQAPDPLLAGDANGSCTTNGLDVTYLVNFFKGSGLVPVRGDCEEVIASKIQDVDLGN